MNYQEAREIVDKTPWEFNIAQPHVLYFEAKAYLEAHGKAEKLVKALEFVSVHECQCTRSQLSRGHSLFCEQQVAKEALLEWRQSNGVGKP